MRVLLAEDDRGEGGGRDRSGCKAAGLVDQEGRERVVSGGDFVDQALDRGVVGGEGVGRGRAGLIAARDGFAVEVEPEVNGAADTGTFGLDARAGHRRYEDAP